MAIVFNTGNANTGTPTVGTAVLPFVWDSEMKATVTGQYLLKSSSRITATIISNTDDIYAQDWLSPIVRNVVVGVGFDVLLRPLYGTFKGNVTVSWLWQ